VENARLRTKTNCIAAQGTRGGGIYVIDTVGCEAAIEVVYTASADLSTSHARLGHANIRGIVNM
jgi:hypothetical protein